ncbi:hypothetical protein KUTeg_000628 [Tegillarca granosa]|uniref:Uncharacterized protein n=1 Tax=Tegillarca granosa TaxID=220873 RepID=A0ABQ9FZ50_TEGGR|nr:hypothetical protein KUTeg_000628 [Tegillarca granosa]
MEPEAASIFCQHLKTERSASDGLATSPTGTEYMVIDIGGGTADITVHKKLKDGKLEEVLKASGGPWGGTEVDQLFISLLINIVGSRVWGEFRREFTEEYLDMMREFEVAKRKVDAGDTKDATGIGTTVNIKIPAHLHSTCKSLNKESLMDILTSGNFPYSSKINITADKFMFDKDVIKTLFMKVINHIIKHVQTILDTPKAKNVSVIILAGGFAESPLVQDVFQENFTVKGLRLVIVFDEAGLAVLKRAVLFGHRPYEITARQLRYTYGVALRKDFEKEKHPDSKKITIENKNNCLDIFNEFVTQGTLIDLGTSDKKILYH